MRNGNGTTGGGGGGSGDVQPLTCDVGLSLNTESSYPCKKTSFMATSSPHHNQNRYHQCHRSSEIFAFYGGLTNPTADRVMGSSGKVLFTETQWQELEKQAMIYKYIMASIPVPPQLILSLSTQSNRVSTGLKFSNGSDPEPWRCRRTDGKKWRCSKDVAPDQKYCERHSHKARNRSRKHVESQSRHNKDNPTMLSAANQQTRCNELFVKNGAITVSEPNNQFLQPMHSPSGRSKRGQILNPDFKGNHQQNSYLHHNNLYLNTSGAGSGSGIDSWSRSGSGDDCSLTLLMQSSGDGPKFDHEGFQMAVGMLSGDRRVCGDEFKPHHQFLNQSSWGDSTPGGPLGEALCLGITGDSDTLQNEPSLHGYNNSTPGGDHELGFLK